MIKIPEVQLQETLSLFLTLLRNDLQQTSQKESTLLYQLVGGQFIGAKFNAFEQMRSVLLAPPSDPRYLDVHLFFNSEKAAVPSIHLMLNSDNQTSTYVGNNRQEPDFGMGSGLVDNLNQEYRETTSRRFSVSYNAVVTSNNSYEVVLLYHILKSCLLAYDNSLEVSGLQEIKISGQDLQLMEEIVPANCFTRALVIELSYELEVPDFFKQKFLNGLTFTPAPHGQ